MVDLCAVDNPKDLQPVQGLHGETELEEEELDPLLGYRGSSPVRIGNDAASQRQLGTYGELVLAIDQTVYQGSGVSDDRREDIESIVNYVCECWNEKDAGIWEVRTAPQHFTCSKLMCWLALDRGISMAKQEGLDAPLCRWRTQREQVRRAIEKRGYGEQQNSFVQTFGGSETLDATSLLVPIVGFLPFDDDRVRRTIDTTIEVLITKMVSYRGTTATMVFRGRKGRSSERRFGSSTH